MPAPPNAKVMSDERVARDRLGIVCECTGCNAKTHEAGNCQADFTVSGKLWERRTWAEHINTLLCPECWQEIAATQTPQPGIIS